MTDALTNDQIAARLRLYAEGLRSDALRKGHGRELASAYLLDEAATRLSLQAGGKVEAVARALCRKRLTGNNWHSEYRMLGAELEAAVDLCWPQHKDEARTVIAALAALPTPTAGEVMDGWQPWSTVPAAWNAPVLAYRPDAGVFEAVCHPVDEEENADEAIWWTAYGDDLTGIEPTHWRPLPEAPR